MSITSTIEMVCLGFAFGAFGGLFGVGGGVIAIPALVLLFKMGQQAAQGTALVMILPSAVLGFWKYKQRNPIDLRMAALLCASAMLATYLAARMANAVSSTTLRLAFGAFLFAVACYLAWKALVAGGRRPGPALTWPHSWLVGVTGGFLSGLFGVGGATIAPPALTLFFGLTQTAAQGLALAMIIPGAVVALAVYTDAGTVNWPMGVALAAGGMIAVPLGVVIAHALPAEKLKLLFCGFLMLSATMIIAGH